MVRVTARADLNRSKDFPLLPTSCACTGMSRTAREMEAFPPDTFFQPQFGRGRPLESPLIEDGANAMRLMLLAIAAAAAMLAGPASAGNLTQREVVVMCPMIYLPV